MRLAIICGLALVSSVAAAQPTPAPYPPPPPDGAAAMPPPAAPPAGYVVLAPRVPPLPVTMERHGLFGGGGIYGGNIQCDGMDCGDGFREAGGANGHIGFMITPRLGLLLDAWAQGSSKNDVSLTYVTTTIGARLWLAPRLWVQGTVGNGHAIARVSIFEAQSDDVPVGALAAGVEVAHGPGWALDVQARVAQGSKTDEAGNDVTTGRMVGVGASVSFFQRRPHPL